MEDLNDLVAVIEELYFLFFARAEFLSQMAVLPFVTESSAGQGRAKPLNESQAVFESGCRSLGRRNTVLMLQSEDLPVMSTVWPRGIGQYE